MEDVQWSIYIHQSRIIPRSVGAVDIQKDHGERANDTQKNHGQSAYWFGLPETMIIFRLFNSAALNDLFSRMSSLAQLFHSGCIGAARSSHVVQRCVPFESKAGAQNEI